uniref:ABC transporter permease n=1 Tax=Aminobacter niigataensis TaxID=83265 RepID=UPI0028529756|nr:ABC transporter permease [Aminobacter niigataensis]WMD00120.1 ABC transporter permease [Aminobacter niigataensis]
MIQFLANRIAFGCVAVLVVSILIFSLTRLVPTSPGLLILGADASNEAIAAFEARYGLDKSLVEQYFIWLNNAVTRWDFGTSYISGQSISQEIAETLPVTLKLIIISMVLCLCIALPLGIVSAFRPGSIADHVARLVAVLGVSTPGFWLGLVLILLFAVNFRVLPPGDLPPLRDGFWPHVQALILPSFCLAIYYTAVISRMTRSAVLEVLNQDYVRTAVAMGLTKTRVRTLYILKNALIPVVSVVAMSCGYMFGWAIVIEQVFNLPGICRALLAAIFARDYGLVQAAVLVITVVFVSLNILADVAYRLLNPRVSW